MLYTTCPTCGFFIAQKTLEYEKGKLDICSNPLLTDKENLKKKKIWWLFVQKFTLSELRSVPSCLDIKVNE